MTISGGSQCEHLKITCLVTQYVENPPAVSHLKYKQEIEKCVREAEAAAHWWF